MNEGEYIVHTADCDNPDSLCTSYEKCYRKKLLKCLDVESLETSQKMLVIEILVRTVTQRIFATS